MRGRMITWLLPLAIAGVAGAGAAMAATATHTSSATVKAANRSPYGMILVSSSGRTLYRYTKDSKRVNRCTTVSVCNKYWPPLVVKGTTKPTAGAGVSAALLGTIKIAHGMRQVTYAGFPLYFFAGDARAGQLKGQNFLKEWYVVNERGALVRHATSGGGVGGGGYGSTTTTTTTSGTTTGSSWG
jgi:predicted lipoprotein with Yx(FWY)xxD motif